MSRKLGLSSKVLLCQGFGVWHCCVRVRMVNEGLQSDGLEWK